MVYRKSLPAATALIAALATGFPAEANSAEYQARLDLAPGFAADANDGEYQAPLDPAAHGPAAGPQAGASVAGQPLAVVDLGGLEPSNFGVREWSELFSIYADLGAGRFLIANDLAAARIAVELGRNVHPLQEIEMDAPVYRVVGAGAVERTMLESLGTILWREEGQVVIAPSVERDLWALAGKGVNLYKVADKPFRPMRAEPVEVSAHFAAPEHAEIDEIVALVDGSNVQVYVDELVAFGTRHSNLPGGAQAQAYLKEKFESFGYDQVAELAVPNVDADNVCASLPGTVTPGTVYIVGGHYDSTSTDTSDAPGADDNASGTAGVLEVARVLAGYSFESTLVFCGYAGEELGLLGSAAHAQALDESGTNVAGMINLDMIGYLAAGDAVDVDVASNAASAPIRTLIGEVVARYLPDTEEVDGQLPNGASSDHAPFQQRGFPAVMLFEDTGNSSPFIHTANDQVGNSFNSPVLAEKITRTAAATLAAMAGPVDGSPDPDPDPTPDTGDPGNPADGEMETIHGGCACALDGGGTRGLPGAGALVLLAAFAAGAIRRR